MTLSELKKLFVRSSATAADARLAELRYVVFDTEFTSLEQRSNRLLSLGAVVMEGARIRVGEQFYRVTNPGVAVPGKSVVVHKLRPDDIAQAEPPQLVLKDFQRFSAGAVLVGHFLHYDIDIVNKERAKAGIDPSEGSPAHIDTVRVHRWLELHRRHYPVEAFDERAIPLDLASVARHYGVEFDDAHQALADAFVTAQVWQRQLALLSTKGIRTWRDLKPALR